MMASVDAWRFKMLLKLFPGHNTIKVGGEGNFDESPNQTFQRVAGLCIRLRSPKGCGRRPARRGHCVRPAEPSGHTDAKVPVVICNGRILQATDTIQPDSTLHIFQPVAGG
jgi:hypothetical protein